MLSKHTKPGYNILAEIIQLGPTLYIEPAHPEDVPAIVAVHQESLATSGAYDEPQFGVTKEALRTFVDGEFAQRKQEYWRAAIAGGTGVFVARHSIDNCSSVIGFGAGQDLQPGVSKLSALYVHPDYQQKGVGTALLQKVLVSLKEPIVRLDVARWTGAVLFFTAQGFTATNKPISTPDPPKAYGIMLELIEMEMMRHG